MKAILDKGELLFDIEETSRTETAQLTDAEARYRVQAGAQFREGLDRALTLSVSRLNTLVQRFLFPDATPVAGNDIVLPDQIVFDFDFSERRAQGKAQPLTDAMHAYLVHDTLAAHYRNTASGDLATVHVQSAEAAAAQIIGLIHSKTPPLI